MFLKLMTEPLEKEKLSERDTSGFNILPQTNFITLNMLFKMDLFVTFGQC